MRAERRDTECTEVGRRRNGDGFEGKGVGKGGVGDDHMQW
jgi:hypothetical protein